MPFTSHGHHIPGTVKGDEVPDRIARCGGPRMCVVCKADVAKYFGSNAPLEPKQVPIEETTPTAPEKEVVDPKIQAKLIVVAYFNRRGYTTWKAQGLISVKEVYVFSFRETPRGWKALIGTTIPDDMIYEVIFNGDRDTTKLIAYKKFDQQVLVLRDLPPRIEGENE